MAQIGMSFRNRGTEAEHQGPLPINVHPAERLGSILVGGGLLVAAFDRRPLTGLILGLLGGGLIHRGVTGHCHAYGALGIDTTGRHAATAVPAQQGYRVEKSITINRPAEELFERWQDFEELPTVMDHLVRVEMIDDKLSHWVAKGPLGTTIEWDAEVICQRENRVISWRSLSGSTVDTAGSVHFSPKREGASTQVRVNLKYNPPAGKVGASFAAFLGEGLDKQLEDDLERFKQTAESVQVSQSQPASAQSTGGTSVAWGP